MTARARVARAAEQCWRQLLGDTEAAPWWAWVAVVGFVLVVGFLAGALQ